MAQKTYIDGTGYKIKVGRTLCDGTGYLIKRGRTLVNGVGYDIVLSAYSLSTFLNEYQGDISAQWGAIKAGQDLLCTLQTKITQNITSGTRPLAGFILSGLKSGDQIELVWSVSTTANGAYWIDGVLQSNGGSNAVVHRTQTADFDHLSFSTASPGGTFYILLSVGRACSYTYTTTLTIHSLKVNGEQII